MQFVTIVLQPSRHESTKSKCKIRQNFGVVGKCVQPLVADYLNILKTADDNLPYHDTMITCCLTYGLTLGLSGII